MKAAIYVRVSTEEQVSGHSLSYQLDDCRTQAIADGFAVDDAYVYRDEGISATSALKRPAFQRMIADAGEKPRPFDRIYVWKWDRFSRDRDDNALYKSLLRRDLGVEVVSLKERTDDPDSPHGYLSEGFSELIAGWYSRDLRQKVTRSRQRRIELGLANGDPPFGYARNPLTTKENPLPWIVVEEEARAVREMFSLYATGTWSTLRLAKWFNDQGFVTRNKRRSEDKHGNATKATAKGWITGPAAFTKDSVKDMLHNALYTGAVTYKGNVVGAGKHDAIIEDQTLFDRCQEIMRTNPRRPKSPNPKRKRDYSLSGILRCAGCRRLLIGNATKARDGTEILLYRDPSALKHLECSHAGKGMITAKLIEQRIFDLLHVLPQDGQGHVVALLESSSTDVAEKQRQRTIEELKRRSTRVGDRYEFAEIDKATYEARLKEIDAQIKKLTEPAPKPKTDPKFHEVRKELLEHFGKVDLQGMRKMLAGEFGIEMAWQDARQQDYERLHSALRQMFEAIYIDMRTEGRGNLVTPSLIIAVSPRPEFYAYFAEGTSVTWRQTDLGLSPMSDDWRETDLAPSQLRKENASRKRKALAGSWRPGGDSNPRSPP